MEAARLGVVSRLVTDVVRVVVGYTEMCATTALAERLRFRMIDRWRVTAALASLTTGDRLVQPEQRKTSAMR